jgi:AbrB family looped-hinge helix DNA binding protein
VFKRPEFFGSTTVGERGQIVLPAELRKRYQIKAGDKLIVLGMQGIDNSGTGHVMLLKAEVLNGIIGFMEQQQKAIKDILHENENQELNQSE